MTLTLSEILNLCDNWDYFCEKSGYSVWAVNEGGGDITVDLTIDQARDFGIISTTTQRGG